MRTIVEAFSVPKAGNSPDEYEDAFWLPEPGRGETPTLLLAVADGATEASFSRIWAGLLVAAFGRGELNANDIDSGLARLQNEWGREVGTKPLPWYAEEKLREGAFATLLGVQLDDSAEAGAGGGTWNAVAVGDSCLFHVRGPSLLRAFPLEKASEFDSRPVLLSSVSTNNGRLREAVRQAHGTWEAKDTFYLMTDALACWFLRRLESLSNDGPSDFFDLPGTINDQSTFEQIVSVLRTDTTADGTPMLKNDDLTMVRCTILEPDAGGDDAVAARQ